MLCQKIGKTIHGWAEVVSIVLFNILEWVLLSVLDLKGIKGILVNKNIFNFYKVFVLLSKNILFFLKLKIKEYASLLCCQTEL